MKNFANQNSGNRKKVGEKNLVKMRKLRKIRNTENGKFAKIRENCKKAKIEENTENRKKYP